LEFGITELSHCFFFIAEPAERWALDRWTQIMQKRVCINKKENYDDEFWVAK
jgi:hypothetical protein